MTQNKNNNKNNKNSIKNIEIDAIVASKAVKLAKILADATGCIDDSDATTYLREFKTIGDAIAVAMDVDAWNLYYKTCAPSAQRFLLAIALLGSACYLSNIDAEFCEKVYKGLGYFILSKDARAFADLDH